MKICKRHNITNGDKVDRCCRHHWKKELRTLIRRCRLGPTEDVPLTDFRHPYALVDMMMHTVQRERNIRMLSI